MKTLIKLLFVVGILIIVGAAAIFIYIDAIAKQGVERGASFALGVPTTVDSVDVQVLSGEVELADLLVANPEGFDAPHFMDLDEGGVGVSLASLREKVVEMPHLTLEELDVHLQRRAGNANYRIILDNLGRFENRGRAADDGKRFVVQQVDITNIAIHVDMLPEGGTLTQVDVPIERVQLRDVGEGDPRGVTLGELSSIIVKAIIAAAVEQAGDVIPADILNDLQGHLAQLQSLDQLGITVLAGSGEQLEAVIGDIEEIRGGIEEKVRGEIEDIEGKAGDIIKDAGGVLGGDKDDDGS